MNTQPPNVRTQSPRDFTVQIRNAQDRIVGTGFIISPEGKIVTCAHVLRAAGIEPRQAGETKIDVYFPKAVNEEEKRRHARVIAYFSQCDDDVTLLQLLNLSTPLPPRAGCYPWSSRRFL